MAIITASTKGQICIPASLRRKYGIQGGSRLHVYDENGKIVIVPAMKDPVKEACGLFKGRASALRALLEERKRESQREEGELRSGQ
jgi:AbrB family looped-hinge helix DNA binding protein